MKSNWTILRALAERPGGRASLDAIEALATDQDRPEIAAVLDEFDIFQSGMVIRAGEELQITDEGRSALRVLEASTGPSSAPSEPMPLVSLGIIDALIGAEDRRKIFGLDLRRNQTDLDPKAPAPRDVVSAPPLPPIAAEAEQRPRPDRITPVRFQETSDTDWHNRKAIADVPRSVRVSPAPVVAVRDGISPDIQAHDSVTHRHRSAFAARLHQVAGIWRRHLERDAPGPISEKRPRTSGAVAAFITLLVLIICAGAVFAYTRIRSLQSENAALQRELSPLRERMARAEFLEKAKQTADQQREAQSKAAAVANKGNAPPRAEQLAFSLTPDEIRLIRDFIKPAPVGGSPASPINVGDTVSIATIPLPSSLMEKIPKLLGARFTTRNGSIIILRRDSRQADLVLPPN